MDKYGDRNGSTMTEYVDLDGCGGRRIANSYSTTSSRVSPPRKKEDFL